MSRKAVWIALGIVGAIVVVGHLIGLAFLGMKLSDWVGGTVIGLVLVVVVAAHLAIPAHGRGGNRAPRRQVLWWGIAIVVGVVEGLVASLVQDTLGYWLLLPWVITVLAFGMVAEGEPPHKAIRLGAFGFASIVVFAASVLGTSTLSDVATTIGLGVVGALSAVLIGLLAHIVIGRLPSHRAVNEPVGAEASSD